MLRNPAHITLLVLDVDGTLTDGIVHYDSAGHEHRAFHIHDGLGIVMARAVGFAFAILSGRKSEVVTRRMKELGITEIVLGSGDKARDLRGICERQGVEPAQTAYMGDDLNDLPAFDLAGYALAPADAMPTIRAKADWTAPRPGGRGAVRDAIDHILDAQGLTEKAASAFLTLHKASTLPTQ